MRGLVNEVGTAILNYNGYIYIPNLRENLETYSKLKNDVQEIRPHDTLHELHYFRIYP